MKQSKPRSHPPESGADSRPPRLKGDINAPISTIVESDVRPEGRLRLGTALAGMSRKIGVTNADVDALGEVLGETRDGTPAEPLRLR